MDKIDYKKKLSEFYAAKIGVPVTVTVPKMNYIMVDGHGDPNTSQDYMDAIQALYPVVYGIKFFCKQELGVDFGVMPLEGLWWMKDMENFSTDKKDDWLWTAMIMQPDIVSKDIFEKVIKQVVDKKGPKAIDKVRFSSYNEGRAAQVMYIGPYSDEGPTIQNLHSYITEQGGTLNSGNKHHHEIYFSDPRRTNPTKLKTIIRQPY
jgi:hypothetical protein